MMDEKWKLSKSFSTKNNSTTSCSTAPAAAETADSCKRVPRSQGNAATWPKNRRLDSTLCGAASLCSSVGINTAIPDEEQKQSLINALISIPQIGQSLLQFSLFFFLKFLLFFSARLSV
ncbi:hypothetical protein LINPERPRIM_LOCUS18158 [Linum perenne]